MRFQVRGGIAADHAPGALGKAEVPVVGWKVYYKATESNIFGMMQAMPQTPVG